MVTLKEVAKEAGVSPQTVSRAVSGKGYVAAETRARVNAAIRRLGYAPKRVASSIATGRTLSIGMVVPDIRYSFFPEIVLGAETEARQAATTSSCATRQRATSRSGGSSSSCTKLASTASSWAAPACRTVSC
jgi:DNA-binding LacI/PurR family transcriptional regulator